MKNKKSTRIAKKVFDVSWTYLLLIIISFIFFFPCLWLILASFSTTGSIYSFKGFFQIRMDSIALKHYLQIQRCITIKSGF